MRTAETQKKEAEMATITQQEEKTGFWEGVISLKPLKKHFEWWVKLIAITVIPIVIICTVVIGMELTTPDLFKQGIGYAISVIAENALNLGVEASMFGCIILAKDAKKRGSTKHYATMLTIGVFFAGLTITTVGFKLFSVPDMANQVLLIIRDAAVIGYVFVSHLEDDDDENEMLTPEQVATLEARLQEQVANITATVIGASSRLVASVEQQVSTQVATQVAKEVAQLETVISQQVARSLATYGEQGATPVASDSQLSEQVAHLVGLLHEQARTIQNLTSSFAEVRREVRTTVTEIRSISHDSAPLPQLTGPTVDATTEPGARVRAFLSAWNGPKSPTLQMIMDTCQVAKRTATKYRDEYYGLATSSQSEDEE
jgi:hypothetical protein